jgi:PAS domain S-box-containing protein
MVSNSIDPEMSSSEVPCSQIENESLLKNILNSIPMGIVIIDPVTYLIVDANMAASSMTGSQREELVGSICHRHICPASVGKCPINDLNQKVDLSERILLTSSGKEIPILKNVDMISIQGKNYLLESFVDISDHKRTEEALRISEARYRTLFENSAVPILIIEDDTTISLVNAETERLFGYLARDEIGKSWTKFVYKDDLEMMKRYHTLRRTSPSSTPNNYEFRIIDGYGNIRYVLMTIAMLPGSKQSIASLLDITEKKRAQEVLMKSEERYRDLFEGASDLIFSVGSDGELLYANHAWKNALGYADTGIKDIKFCDTVPEDRVESLSGIFKRLSSGESGEEIGLVEAAFRAKNGRKILVEGCVSSKFLDGKMASAMGIFRNITERKNAEDVLGKAMEDLLRSNKELEQFAYIVSHDLQEPLRMVTSFLGLLSRKYKGKLGKDADEYIAFAVDGTTRS